MSWLLFAIAAAVIASLCAVIEKKLLRHEHSLSFSTAHSFLALLLSFPLLLFVDFSKVTMLSIAIVYLGTVVSAIAFYFTTKCIKHLELSISSPLMVVNLAVLPFFAFFFLGERLSQQQLLGVALIFVGVLALELVTRKSNFNFLSNATGQRYFLLMVAAGVLYAITAVIDKYVLGSWNPFTYLFIAHFFLAVNSVLLIVILDKQYKRDLKQLFSQDFKTTFIVSFLSLAHRLMLTIAISQTFVSLAIAIKKLSILLSTLMAGKLFHEENIAQKAAICTIMLAGVALIVLS